MKQKEAKDRHSSSLGRSSGLGHRALLENISNNIFFGLHINLINLLMALDFEDIQGCARASESSNVLSIYSLN